MKISLIYYVIIFLIISFLCYNFLSYKLDNKVIYSNNPDKEIEIMSYLKCNHFGGEQYFLVKNINRNKLEKSFKEIEKFITHYVDTINTKNKFIDFVFIEYSDRASESTIKYPNKMGHIYEPCQDMFNNVFTHYADRCKSDIISYHFCENGELCQYENNKMIYGEITCSFSNRIYGVEYSRTIKRVKRDFTLKK